MDIASLKKIKIHNKEIPLYLLHEYSRHIAREKFVRGKTIVRDMGDIMVFEKGREALHDLILKEAGFTVRGCGGIFRSVEPEQKEDWKQFEKDLKAWIEQYIMSKSEP